MKFLSLLPMLIILLACGAVNASPYTMDFANTTLDLGYSGLIELSDQFTDFGLTFTNVYRYYGRFDPFDQFAITNGSLTVEYLPELTDPDNPPPPPPTALVMFSEATDFVEFEYFKTVLVFPYSITALDENNNVIGSFTGTERSGTGRIDASGIKALRLYGDIYAGISTLTYDRMVENPIPEPVTLVLVGLGLLGLGAAGKRKAR